MKVVIQQDDSKPQYRHQKGYTFQINGGPEFHAAKGSPVGQAIRLVVRLMELGSQDGLEEYRG
jgi:hypothetical protein